MLTHDQIYERLYPIWLDLPGSDAKTKLGGLLADLKAETLEAEPLEAPTVLAVVEGWIHEEDWLKVEKASGQTLDEGSWCPILLYGQVERGQAVTVTIAEGHREA